MPLCEQWERVCNECYNQLPWKYGVAGVIFAAAEFAHATQELAPQSDDSDRYYDRPMAPGDFALNVKSPHYAGLQSTLSCMDHAWIRDASMQADATLFIFSVHGCLPTSTPTPFQIPSTPEAFRDTTALLVYAADSGAYLETVPCFSGVCMVHKEHWNKRLVLIQVGRIQSKEKATVPKAIDAAAPVVASKQVSPKPKPPPPPPRPAAPAVGVSTVSTIVKETTSSELIELYNVYTSLNTKGIRCEQGGRMYYKVPDNLPVLKCHCCEQTVAQKSKEFIIQQSKQLKDGHTLQSFGAPSDFLECAHFSQRDQIKTLTEWEEAAKKIILDHDIASIVNKHKDFLHTYNLADDTLDSFKSVEDKTLVNYEANCKALRQCAKWQRGKNASYPTYTFVLVDVPLKGEDLTKKRRVKSGSSACPWNKVIVNMEVPSESMIKDGVTCSSALEQNCPIFKVPLNKGIEDHMLLLRGKGKGSKRPHTEQQSRDSNGNKQLKTDTNS